MRQKMHLAWWQFCLWPAETNRGKMENSNMTQQHEHSMSSMTHMFTMHMILVSWCASEWQSSFSLAFKIAHCFTFEVLTQFLRFLCKIWLTWSTSRLMRGSPSNAEVSQPLVNTRWKPNDIRVSRATTGSRTMSKAAERSIQFSITSSESKIYLKCLR